MKQYIRLYGLICLLASLAGTANGGAARTAVPAMSVAGPQPNSGAAAPASHQRSGQISWQTVGTNTAQFVTIIGTRRSFYTPLPNVGDSVNYTWIDFGDGQMSSNSLFIVTSVDVVNDVLTAQKTATHTYVSSGPYLASISGPGRPPQINNPNLNWRAETLVDFRGTTASPVTSMAPIVACTQGALCSFVIPASDPDHQQLRFRLATPAEAGDKHFVQPGPPQAPHAASVDADSGLFTWDTQGATLNPNGATYYSTQVMIDNLNVPGFLVSKTPVDFLNLLVP
jgi:hypothetical protein